MISTSILLLSAAEVLSIFHVYDILLRDANVMYRPGVNNAPFPVKVRYYGYRVLVKIFLHNLSLVKPWRLVSPVKHYETAMTEASLGHQLSQRIAENDLTCTHHIFDRYPQLIPNRFDSESLYKMPV
jgi:hypothetical protein